MTDEPQGQPDDFAKWKAEQDFSKWKASKAPDELAALHKEYASGRLAKRMAAENAETQAEVPTLAETASQVLETVAAGVPGAKLAISAARAKLMGRPLADVQREVNAETSDVPYASAAGRALGTIATTPFLPASGSAAGAILGGTEGLLTNEPDVGGRGRLVRGAAGAAVGGAAGAVADRLLTGGRALAAGNAAKVRAGMLRDQAASAKDLYAKAIAEGQGKQAPAEVQAFLGSDDIAPIVKDLQATRVYANTPADSPEMLDAVYKNLSDKAGVIKGKLGALIPRNANLGRVAGKDVGMAKEAELSALEAGPQPFMPSYRTAVQDFANKARGIESFDTGYDALRTTLGPRAVAAKNLNRPNRTSEGFRDWIGGLKSNTADAENATRGVLGMARSEPGGWRLSNMGKAAKLLRATDAVRGREAPNVVQKSLLALLNAGINP